VKHFQLRCSPAKFEDLVLAFKYNSFAIGDGEEVHLFFAPSFVNHSCAPNCHWYCDGQGRFHLMAGEKGLSEGECMSISYLSNEHLESSILERRERLALGWQFYCRCSRCVVESRSADQVPLCGTCAGQHTVILSGRDESPYGDYNVDCDGCGKKDVAVEDSYFFHCTLCSMDLCPACAYTQ